MSVDVSTKLVNIHDASGRLVTSLPISSTWPVGGVVTLEFGASDPPWQVHHTGIDIADPQGRVGRRVTAFMIGRVSKVMNTDNRYGRYVFIDHGNNITSRYYHLSEATVVVGQQVTPGDVIGLEGSTGQSTGPHVHFEVLVYDIPINPRYFIEGNPPSGL
ncbi:Peptidase family M23 [compost metagenome]